MLSRSLIRISLYVALWLVSLILLGLACSRIDYTIHLKRTDPLNDGRPFYDPIVAELIATTVLVLLWAPFAAWTIFKRYERGFLTTFVFEVIGLSVFWLMYLVGAAVASNVWGDLTFCSQFLQCRELMALTAFAWLGWITHSAILLFTVFIPARSNAWGSQMHGYYTDPHANFTFQFPQTAQYRA